MRSETFSTPEPPSLRVNLPLGRRSGRARRHGRDARRALRAERGRRTDRAASQRDRGRDREEEAVRPRQGRPTPARLRAVRHADRRAHGVGRRRGPRPLRRSLESTRPPGDVRPSSGVDGRLEVNTASGDVRSTSSARRCGSTPPRETSSVGEAESDAKIRTASGDIEIRSAARGQDRHPVRVAATSRSASAAARRSTSTRAR